MASQEIDSFVRKFRQLWSAGFCAHLDLDSNAGEAWVGLHLKLSPGLIQQQDVPAYCRQKFDSLSQQRRRARRSASRQSQENSSIEATGKVVTSAKEEYKYEIINDRENLTDIDQLKEEKNGGNVAGEATRATDIVDAEEIVEQTVSSMEEKNDTEEVG